MNVVVDGCSEKIVCRADGMDVPGEMEIDIFHRYEVGSSSTGGPTFNAKCGPKDGSRKQTATFLPKAPSASVRPMDVTVLPSPAGVAVIAVI